MWFITLLFLVAVFCLLAWVEACAFILTLIFDTKFGFFFLVLIIVFVIARCG